MPGEFDGFGDFGASTKQAQSTPVRHDGTGAGNTIVKATLTANETKGDGSDAFLWYMNVTGDADTYDEGSWEAVTNGTEYTFTNTGQWLRWRCVCIGYGGSGTYTDYIKIQVIETS